MTMLSKIKILRALRRLYFAIFKPKKKSDELITGYRFNNLSRRMILQLEI